VIGKGDGGWLDADVDAGGLLDWLVEFEVGVDGCREERRVEESDGGLVRAAIAS